MGGSSWIMQFLFGFPLTGRLSQRGCLPVRTKETSKTPEKLGKISRSAQTRFADRASKSGFKNCQLLWNEAHLQIEKGRLHPPFPLSLDESPSKLVHPRLNVAFRFGVEQGSKLRACDDLRHARTNLACIVETPIKLASWDHVAQLSNLVNTGSRDWSFFKADHEAAYKQLPLAPEFSKLAAVALRSPVDHLWYGFVSRTMVFGAVAAAIRYNVFPRLIAELFTKLFGIPMLVAFDDFGDIIHAEISEAAIRTFALFCSKLGIQLKTEKSEVGRRITFLGLEGDSPCKANGFTISVRLTREKAEAWADQINSYIKAGFISSNDLGELIGKLGFPQTNLFGKFARTQMMPLYKNSTPVPTWLPCPRPSLYYFAGGLKSPKLYNVGFLGVIWPNLI